MQTITRAWLILLALSAASTAVSFNVTLQLPAQIPLLGGIIILLLAWAKARIIAARYLELAQAPAYLRGFSLVLALFMLTLLGLYVAATPFSG
ncbi:cytochrome C oxidase subunit IV family protein [Pseudorhodobacter ferrugineus]|uniref:cytochrome C oxidase subunit IV family protein n=1 Tax=Pseudorhodobacter ferrugineus TaxID=77008 RepID=UPI0003B5B6CA|nr:cytochrome C oxidase subunit IV family protein [Pseudorhodobacter ferrugineus]